MKQYHAHRLMFGTDVMVFDSSTRKGWRLRRSVYLADQATTGFDWGDRSEGAAQLALALLADYLEDDDRAIRLHELFAAAVIAHLPFKEWKLTGSQIDAALTILEADRAEEQALAADEVPA